MAVLLVDNADVVVTMDAERREIPRGSLVVRGREIERVGSADPVAASVTCVPANARLSLINGRIVVEQGRIPGLDLGALVQQYNPLAAELFEPAAARGTP